MKHKKLTSKQRGFLELVSRAVFANPFSEDRAKADLEIAGPSAAGKSEREGLEQALQQTRGFIEALDGDGKGELDAYSGADRQLLETAHLFDVFHMFIDPLDDLIREQIVSEGESVPVAFAEEALGLLAERGFSGPDAVRYFATFYQLRRAYYFIDCALIGRSACMKQLRRALWNNVFTSDMRLYERALWNRMEDFSTLLMGETGTGKGAAATAIGRSGFIPFDERRRRFAASFMSTFIAVNLSQFSESLIESELFGHRKGAFTGAVDSHEGVFARCSPYGSIFLDEIGDVSIPVQIKLLKVLQDRMFSPVGSHERLQFRGRVVSASNRSIQELRRKGAFRDDFFYRMCSDVIIVPPLRRRIAEDPRELDDLLELTMRRILGGAPQAAELTAGLAASVREIIVNSVGLDYAWPGNVRELEQAVRRLLISQCYKGDRLATGEDIEASLVDGIRGGDVTAQEMLSGYCRLLHERYNTYEEVARRTELDRRTVKKYIEMSE